MMPPLGKKQYYVTLEILTATGFDMDNMYIEFDIKVSTVSPQDEQCIVCIVLVFRHISDHSYYRRLQSIISHFYGIFFILDFL